jgi:hypothetical protein
MIVFIVKFKNGDTQEVKAGDRKTAMRKAQVYQDRKGNSTHLKEVVRK